MLTATVMELIEKQRNCETVDQAFIKKVVDSLMLLGVDEEDPQKESLDVYKLQFETPYVETTMKYVKTSLEAARLTEMSAFDFVEETGRLFGAEEERAGLYIRTFDPKEFIKNCTKDLVEDEQIWAEYLKRMESVQREDLRRIYALAASFPHELEPIREKVEELYLKLVSASWDRY